MKSSGQGRWMGDGRRSRRGANHGEACDLDGGRDRCARDRRSAGAGADDAASGCASRREADGRVDAADSTLVAPSREPHRRDDRRRAGDALRAARVRRSDAAARRRRRRRRGCPSPHRRSRGARRARARQDPPQADPEQGVAATDQQIDAYIASIKERNKLDDAALRQALAQQGLTWEQYRAQVRSDIERAALINKEIRNKVNVSPRRSSATTRSI